MTSHSAISLDAVAKRFGTHVAVDDLSLEVADGEIVCLLGPSGCGKTTTLNLVAGFLDPDSGTVRLQGRPMNGVPPHRRNSGMVFQSYALFPHLSVLDNVAFGPRARGAARRDARAAAREALLLVRLDGLEQRMPHQLSGGQQQRVSLARALVYRPEVLLLDEPFSNLDAKLRLSMRDEVKEIQRKVGVSALLVTHDQEEALQLADRIAVMNQGRIEQAGSPEDVYFRPLTRFVADFVGVANFIPVTVVGDNLIESRDGARWRADLAGRSRSVRASGTLMIRPERLHLVSDPVPADDRNMVSGRIVKTGFLGSHRTLEVAAGGEGWRIRDSSTGRDSAAAGDVVGLAWSPDDAVFLDE